MLNMLLGKLSLDAIPFDQPIIMIAGGGMVLGALAVLGLITYLKRWTWLWTEWLTSVDHKKIGIMYIIAALIMLLRGFADAIMMRSQLALSVGENHGFLPPHHYDQVFTAHGVIMIFFMAMPFLFGLMNIIVPLQIGARDVAFPYLNSLSFWLFVVGALLINVSLVIGEFAQTGWLAYPPLSELAYSPTVGVDYYIWSLQISGLGTLIGGVNFIATIMKMRCPGMSLMKMPVFVWTALCANILVVIVFPVLTATLGMLALDRYLGMHFFTSDFGGNPMMYINLIWIWGHPEVYILVLPAFGIYSEVVATFSRKRLFGYTGMVWATGSILILSFIVWLHHFFTMGAGANVNAFFGITTMIISIPTGVKIFNWLFTMFRGRVRFSVPMLWTFGFLFTFTLGGMTGVLQSIPAADFQIHNSLFLVAHFHNTIIGGVVFGYLAGFAYWFPKAFGFKLNEKCGKIAFWCWIVGFFLAFMPLYIVGLNGMTRRLNHYDAATGWHPYMIVAWVGAVIIFVGILFTVFQIVVGFLQRNSGGADVTGDPWDGRTLEWATASPPPFYNFAHLPNVETRDSFWEDKNSGKKAEKRPYEDIHMPRNTAIGFLIAMGSFAGGFALIWHIWWLVVVSSIAIFAFVVYRSFDRDMDYYVTAKEVEEIENEIAKRRAC